MKAFSKSTKVKLALFIMFGAVLTPFAAQGSTVQSAGTVTINIGACDTSGKINTSVSARSVILIADTASAQANSDASTYYYFTETDTALFGATYAYGNNQDPTSCQYSSQAGTVVLNRGRFISSVAAYTETTTNTTDFIQYVGNTKQTGVNGGAYTGSACGNLTVAHASSVTTSCSSGILANYQALNQSNSVQWRDNTQQTGTVADPSSQAFIAVKVAKTAISGAPANTSFVSTETFTVTAS